MKSFLSGRAAADALALKPIVATPGSLPTPPPAAPAPTAAATAARHAGTGHLPQVECVKQGDKVVRLVVTCACGERIEIECLYPGLG